jgi:hypothetical protein
MLTGEGVESQRFMISSKDKELWGIEEDLPNLACDAAFELDNLILGRSEKLAALSTLVDLMAGFSSTSVSGDDKNGPFSNLNPSTAVVLNSAIGESKLSVTTNTIEGLIRDANDIIEDLKMLIDNPQEARKSDLEKVKKFKSFCLFLSKHALATEPTLYDLEPYHPYRK